MLLRLSPLGTMTAAVMSRDHTTPRLPDPYPQVLTTSWHERVKAPDILHVERFPHHRVPVLGWKFKVALFYPL